MLLILSDRLDTHADRVISKLTIKYFRLNLDVKSLLKTIITFENGVWKICFNGAEISSYEITAVWLRRAYAELTLEEQKLSQNDTNFKIWLGEWNSTLTGLYTSLKHLFWLNNISNALKGDNKYYQMQLAKEIGFEMPKTIVSNNKKDLVNFTKLHKDVIVKLMRQDLYEDESGKACGFYTNRINLDKIESFGNTDENPIILQNYIQKAYEVRYTVVGNKHFVCKIESQKSKIANEDWRRYDIAQTPHLAINPPKEIKEKVDLLMAKMGLAYGALDFIVTPDGKWVFLEINCSGQWLWIEDLTGLEISLAIANLLNRKGE